MQSNVVKLPNTLLKMKSADILIDEVSRILDSEKTRSVRLKCSTGRSAKAVDVLYTCYI